jgi:hypothetical protein
MPVCCSVKPCLADVPPKVVTTDVEQNPHIWKRRKPSTKVWKLNEKMTIDVGL